MQMIVCWRVERISTGDSLIARFSSEEEATKIKIDKGSNFKVREESIRLFDTTIEWDPVKFDLASKASGLAKLSIAEKMALGLEYRT